MKKIIIISLAVLLCGLGCYTVIGQKQAVSPKQERREVREKRRAQRQAEFEKFLDSVIMSRNYQFNPQTMQRIPAGPVRQINNPNFQLQVWDGTVDIFLPYIKGFVAPYYFSVINYTVPQVGDYVAEQTNDGWMVTFTSTLFSASTYTFTLEIYSKMGGATLTISNPWYNQVQYTGSISQLY